MADNRLKKYRDVWMIGLVFLISVLAFLPQVGSLGYYHDDWFPTISRISDVKLVEMHWVDRPMMGRWYTIATAILGESPLGWHFFAFLARFAGAVGLFWLARILWPGQRTGALMIALIYAIYPGFMQQPSANNYQNHIVAYGICLLSILLSLLAVKVKKVWIKAIFIVSAVGLTYIYPRMFEGFVGMEGFRFLLLWLMFRHQTIGRDKKAIQKAIVNFLPYLAVTLQFLYWRFFIFTSARVSTDSELLVNNLLNNPAGMALQVAVKVITDFFEMVIGGWVIPAYQLGLTAETGTLVLAILLALGTVGIFIAAYRQLNSGAESDIPDSENDWSREAMWVGALGVLVTLLPVALTGREVQYRIYNDRYTYQSIAPAAVLLTGILFTAFKASWRVYAAALLIVSALFTHTLNGSVYAKNWSFQKQVWWQMSWRVPQLAPGTVLMVHMPPAYHYPEDFEIWAPASRIYYPGPGPLQVTAEVLNAETADVILNREVTFRNYRGVEFNKDYSQALITSMPTNDSCLHVLDGAAAELSVSEDPLVVKVSGISRLDRILTRESSHVPPQVIFGREPQHDWCYTYQKASLARQQGNWEEVVRLADEAFAAGLAPKDGIEYAPLIEGYLHSERISDAQDLADQLRETEPATVSRLCEKYSVSTSPAVLEIAALAKSITCEK